MHLLAVRQLGWWMCALSLTVWAAHFVVWAVSGFPSGLGDPEADWNDAFLRLAYALSMGTASVIGGIVIARQPSNPIGWIVAVAGLLVGLELAAGVYATSRVLAAPGQPAPASATVAWVGNLFEVNWVLIVPLLLLFPDGRLPSGRWRPVLWLTGVAALIIIVRLALSPGPLNAAPSIDNPLANPEFFEAWPLFSYPAGPWVVAAMALSALALVLRFRGARGDQRQQLKWITSAAVIWVLGVAAIYFAPPGVRSVMEVVYALVLGGFVAAFGVGILKYRLYDIDVVISRALVYGTLAAGIGLVYVAVVAGLGAVVGTRGEPNIVLSLVATALIALAFGPLRERVQRLANRLVYGERATPYAVLAGLSRRIGNALSIDQVLPQLVEATTQGVGAVRGRVRVYVPGGTDRAVAWPPEALGSAFEHTTPVLHQGQPVGEIAVSKRPGEALTPAERALLEDLAAQAGPAFSNVRLAEELRASRQRIVAAQDAERRRIERDLHDGAQQHLVALSINLRLLQELVEADTRAARELVSEVQGQATEALTTLRDLARGIYPPALADRGIVAALEGHAAKSQQPVSLDVDAEATRARYAPEVEAAVYFCVLEALQNCAKHAPGAAARVSLSSDAEWLRFAVADDGPGFARAAVDRGSGLQGMVDRVAAVGGTLEVRSATGQGTTIAARMPAGPYATTHVNGSSARR